MDTLDKNHVTFIVYRTTTTTWNKRERGLCKVFLISFEF